MANLTPSTQNPDDAILHFGDLIGNALSAQTMQRHDLNWYRFGKFPISNDSRRTCACGAKWFDDPIFGTVCGSITVDDRIYVSIGFDTQDDAVKFELYENTRRIVP